MFKALSLCCAACLAAQHESPQQSAAQHVVLTLRVEGLSEVQGTLLAGIYDSAEGAFDPANSRFGKRIPASAGPMTLCFRLPPGDYAAAVIHDLNGNGKLDRSVFGIPREPYGFSNGAARPDFEKARFTISRDTALTIKLQR